MLHSPLKKKNMDVKLHFYLTIMTNSLKQPLYTVTKVAIAERFYWNSSWIYLVFTPSNIPVLMKNGQTTVV